MRRIQIILIASCATALLNVTAAHAASWTQQSFSGHVTPWVEVNDRRPEQVATEVDGTLHLSNDEGETWSVRPAPAAVNAIAYDPNESQKIYIATTIGLYASADFGLTWSELGGVATHNKIVVAVIATGRTVYVLAGDGSGMPNSLIGVDPSTGLAGRLVSGANNPLFLSYERSHNRLYVGWRDGVVVTSDNAITWRTTVSGEQGPQGMRDISDDGSNLNLLTDLGVYSSPDNGLHWNRRTTAWQFGHEDWGYNVTRIATTLIADQESGIYGVFNANTAQTALVGYRDNNVANLNLPAPLRQIAGRPTKLWAATNNGLWVSQDITTTSSGSPPIQRPVVVIPGILGSWPTPASLGGAALGLYSEQADPLVLDPFHHTYDNLITYLKSRGYSEGQTLFTFPYEWRQDNTITAHQLAERITDIKRRCGCSAVDVVAHSMGGLVARSYIEGGEYHNDVNRLIQVATPNQGSVKDYATYEAGVFGSGDILGALAHGAFRTEAIAHGYASLASYIRNDVASVRQLLPITSYISDRTYPTGYPRNPWLEALNEDSALAHLSRGTAVFTIGSGDRPTVASLEVEPAHLESSEWPDGKTARQFTQSGDGTVTLQSLRWLMPLAAQTNGDHGGVLSSVATLSEIGKILLGSSGAAFAPISQTDANKLAITASGGSLEMQTAVSSEPLSSGHFQQLVLNTSLVADNLIITARGLPGASYTLWSGSSDNESLQEFQGSFDASGTASYRIVSGQLVAVMPAPNGTAASTVSLQDSRASPAIPRASTAEQSSTTTPQDKQTKIGAAQPWPKIHNYKPLNGTLYPKKHHMAKHQSPNMIWRVAMIICIALAAAIIVAVVRRMWH